MKFYRFESIKTVDLSNSEIGQSRKVITRSWSVIIISAEHRAPNVNTDIFKRIQDIIRSVMIFPH